MWKYLHASPRQEKSHNRTKSIEKNYNNDTKMAILVSTCLSVKFFFFAFLHFSLLRLYKLSFFHFSIYNTIICIAYQYFSSFSQQNWRKIRSDTHMHAPWCLFHRIVFAILVSSTQHWTQCTFKISSNGSFFIIFFLKTLLLQF